MSDVLCVIIEKGDSNFSAFSPQVPGCAAAGDTIEETLKLLAEGITFHIEEMDKNERDLFVKDSDVGFKIEHVD